MFSNLKVNNSESINSIMPLKQDADNPGVKPAGADFYSMVMDYSHEPIRRDNNERRNSSETSSVNNTYEKSRPDQKVEDNRLKGEDKQEPKSAITEKGESVDKSVQPGEKPVKQTETSNAEKDKKSEPDLKNKKRTELEEFIQSSAGEMLLKKISDLAQGSVKGNSEDFAKKFRKIVDDVLSAGRKNTAQGNELISRMTGEKSVTQKETPAIAMTDFFDKLGRELSKMLTGKKGNEKAPVISEKELKETIGAIIEDIKKGRTRNSDRIEVRRSESEEIKGEKKNELTGELIQLKKKDGGDSSPDMNSGKEKNSSREGNSFAAGRSDAAGRSGIDKNDAAMKSPEFRQSLQEIIDKAKISVKDSNNATFTVKLFPKDLGSVNVNLLMENGVVSGRFLVDNDDTKNLLLNNLGTLREQLAEAGIQVGEFNVNVNHEGERFAAKEKEDEKSSSPASVKRESETAVLKYDYNSTAAHNGHINMVI